MKKSDLVKVLTIAACLLSLSTTGYAWEDVHTREAYDYNVDKGGNGWADHDYDNVGTAFAKAMVEINGSETNTRAEADAYETMKVVIVDYDGETLTATATCYCGAEADALWDTSTSSYVVVAESDGWAIGCGLYEGCDAQAVMISPDTSDTDSDYFSETADMSSSGATIWYGHSADADAEASYTGDKVYIEGEAWSTTEVDVVEEEP